MRNNFTISIFIIFCLNLHAQVDLGIWEAIKFPKDNISVLSIAVNAKGVILAVCEDHNVGRSHSHILFRSCDDGITWLETVPPIITFIPIEAIGNRFYYNWNRDISTMYTYFSDDGLTWIKEVEEPPSGVNYYYGPNKRIVYSKGINENPYVYERKGPIDWQKIGELNLEKPIRRVDRPVIKLGLYDYEIGRVPGRNYSDLVRPKYPLYNTTAANYSTSAFGHKIFGGNPLYSSSDNGNSWQRVESADFRVNEIFRSCNPLELFVSASQVFEKFIAHTKDGGKTWIKLKLPVKINNRYKSISPHIRSLKFNPQGTGYLLLTKDSYGYGNVNLFKKSNLTTCRN